MDKWLSVIIVTYNNADTISDCLRSLDKFLPQDAEIIIVDNASGDNTLKITGRHNKKLIVLPQSENLGYSKANNIGVQKSRGQYLLFLNPDTRLNSKIIPAIDYLESHPDVGVLGLKLIGSVGKVQPSVRKLPTLKGALKEYYFHQNYSYEAYVPKGNSPQAVESVVGAAILIKKTVFKRAGGFDEKYFLYFEDLELCRHIRSMGLKVVYFPQVSAHHVIGASSHSNPKTYLLLRQSSRQYHGLIKFYLLELLLRFRARS